MNVNLTILFFLGFHVERATKLSNYNQDVFLVL